jgi:hypothetical protein
MRVLITTGPPLAGRGRGSGQPKARGNRFASRAAGNQTIAQVTRFWQGGPPP